MGYPVTPPSFPLVRASAVRIVCLTHFRGRCPLKSIRVFHPGRLLARLASPLTLRVASIACRSTIALHLALSLVWSVRHCQSNPGEGDRQQRPSTKHWPCAPGRSFGLEAEKCLRKRVKSRALDSRGVKMCSINPTVKIDENETCLLS